jgi:hypothetical protein
MELYFNPYPGAVKNTEDGIGLVIKMADTLSRLLRDLQHKHIQCDGRFAEFDCSPSDFIIIREKDIHYRISDVIYKIDKTDNKSREKVKLMLILFSKGKVIKSEEIGNLENWTVKNVGAVAPILEIAAKKGAISLTIPTEPAWRICLIEFENRAETLHNLWGQDDISSLKDHCIKYISNVKERFKVRYDAHFCDSSLNSAPDLNRWERFGFFENMDKAKARGYKVDSKLIKSIGNTKYGNLLELRCFGEGHRIFFAYIKDATPQILIGGFFQKNRGVNQAQAIKDANTRINNYRQSDCHDL